MQCHLFNVPCGSDLSPLSGNKLCKFWWSHCWWVLHPEQRQHSWGCEYTQTPWSATTAVKRNKKPSHPHTVWSWFLHWCWWNGELLNLPEDPSRKDHGLGWSEPRERMEKKYTQTKLYFVAPRVKTKQQNTIWLQVLHQHIWTDGTNGARLWQPQRCLPLWLSVFISVHQSALFWLHAEPPSSNPSWGPGPGPLSEE